MIPLTPFAVEVVSKRSTKKMEGKGGCIYIAIPDGTEYGLKLINDHFASCDAEVHIDNQTVGTFRIKAKSSWVVERPANEARKFTFVKETTKRAESAGIQAKDHDNGLVSVTFRPEREMVIRLNESKRSPEYEEEECCALGFGLFGDDDEGSKAKGKHRGAASGATLLGESSAQKFRDADPIREYDDAYTRKIVFRLIVLEPETKEIGIKAFYKCKKELPVPPRVDDE